MTNKKLIAVDAMNGYTYIGRCSKKTVNKVTLRNYAVENTSEMCKGDWSFERHASGSYIDSRRSNEVEILNPIAIHSLRSEAALDKLLDKED